MNSLYFKICSLLILFFGVTQLSGQNFVKISGKVIDAQSKEPLPFATVVFIGNESVGTTTDFDGTYSIETQWGTDSLQASFLGYDAQIKIIDANEPKLVIDFELEPEVETLTTIEVTTQKGRYRRKDNPAVGLIKNVMAHKSKNRMQGQDFYEYDQYEKMELSLNNFTDEFKNKKYLKKFQFIFDYVDTSAVNGKPYLPFYIREVASKVYYRKNPASKKEYRQGIKLTGLEDWVDNQSLAMLNDVLYQELDIYENNIDMFGQSFVSPLNEVVGNFFYRYYIVDTIEYKGMEVIDLAFMPADKQDLGFKGNLYILNDSTYAVVRADLGFTESINLNWIHDLELIQEFEKKDSVWILSKDEVVTDFALSKKSIGIFGSRTVLYSNHIFNKEREASIYNGPVKVIEAENAYEQDTSFWKAARLEPLSEKEKGIYKMVDTLQHVPAFRNAMDLLTLVVSGYLDVGLFDIGSFGTFYSFNPVEGFRLRFGGTTTPKLFPKLQIEGFGMYGFGDKKWKYGLGLTYSFKDNFRENPRHSLGISYQKQTSFVGQKFDFVVEETFFLSFKRGDASKLLLLEALELNYFYEFPSDLSFNIRFKNQRHTPLGSLKFNYFDPEFPAELQELSRVNISELYAHIRWSPNEKYVQGQNFRHPIYGRNPIFNLWYQRGLKGVLGGDYNYNRLEFDVFKRIYLPPFGFTHAIAEVGKIWGKGVPYYLLLLPRANQTFSYKHRYFNMMNYLEFTNDYYAAWNFEHHFNGYIFNKIPLFKKLKLREIVTFKGIWGGLSPHNDPNQNQQLIQFLSDANGTPQTYTLKSKPYMEASVGVGNIFKIIRLDLVKRLSYLNNPQVPQMFGVRGLGIRFKAGFDF